MGNGRFQAALASAVYAFVVFCKVYSILDLVICVREHLKCLVTILALTNSLLYRRDSISNVEGLAIVYGQLALLAAKYVSAAGTE